jgi:HEAT repeat protein
LAKIGDPAPLPMFIAFLNEAAAQPKAPPEAIAVAIEAVGDFADKRSLVALRKLAVHPELDQKTVVLVLTALAKIGDPADAEMLVKRIKDDTIPWMNANRIAGSLANHGNEAAREFLVEEYRAYLRDLENSDQRNSDPNLYATLGHLTDPVIREKLEALIPEQRRPTAKRNIETLIDWMAFNRMSPERLLNLAPDTSQQSRGAAIGALAEVGTPDQIPALMSIQPLDMDSELDDTAQTAIRHLAAATVYRIQQRHADAIAKSGNKFVQGVEEKLRETHKELLAGRDRFGVKVLPDGSDVTAAARLQFRYAGRQGLYQNADELPHPVTQRKLSVVRQAVMNDKGIKDIFVTKDGSLEVQFKPEVRQRIQNIVDRAGNPEVALVLDHKVIAVIRLPRALGEPLTIRQDALDPAGREELLKMVAGPAGNTAKKPKPAPAK